MRDLSEILGRQTLDLPVNGKVYRVPECDAGTGLLVQKITNISMRADQAKDGKGAEVTEPEVARLEVLVGDDDEEGLYQRILSPEVWDEMLADGVTFQQIKHCSMTAMVWIVRDLETAEQVWEKGAESGEAPAPNRQARRAANRSGAATTTKKPASGSGTNSPAKKTASAGRRSSRTSG